MNSRQQQKEKLTQLKKETLEACEKYYKETRNAGVDRFKTKDYNKFKKLVNEAESLDDMTEIFSFVDHYTYIYDIRTIMVGDEANRIVFKNDAQREKLIRRAKGEEQKRQGILDHYATHTEESFDEADSDSSGSDDSSSAEERPYKVKRGLSFDTRVSAVLELHVRLSLPLSECCSIVEIDLNDFYKDIALNNIVGFLGDNQPPKILKNIVHKLDSENLKYESLSKKEKEKLKLKNKKKIKEIMKKY